MIPQRTGEPHKIVSREQRWEEVRAMFRVHRIILDLMDMDPYKITADRLRAYHLLENERKEMVEKAKAKRSFAFEFFRLLRTFYQLQEHRKIIHRQENIKGIRRSHRKW